MRAGASSGAGYDMIFAEADAYSDGFARIVHATQPERHDPFNIARTDHDVFRPQPTAASDLDGTMSSSWSG